MKREQQTPDWGLMIEQMIRQGLTQKQIGAAMSADLTDRMIYHYRQGTQPLHWRGEALIALWCVTVKAPRSDIPQTMLTRGHRVSANKLHDSSPKLQSLPQWPTSPPPGVAPMKKRGRPRKVAEVV